MWMDLLSLRNLLSIAAQWFTEFALFLRRVIIESEFCERVTQQRWFSIPNVFTSMITVTLTKKETTPCLCVINIHNIWTHFVLCPSFRGAYQGHIYTPHTKPQACVGKGGKETEHLLREDAYWKDLGMSLLKLDYCFLPVQPVVWLTDNRAGVQTEQSVWEKI